MLLRAHALDGPVRAGWEQRQIDVERRMTATRELLARINERFEQIRFTKWLVEQLQDTPRVIPN